MRLVLALLLLCSLALPGFAADTASSDLDWWREARFGLFLHWDMVSLVGTEISWSRGLEIPNEEYDALYKRFNPVDFDPDEWVALAKAAGMKYLVFTTKHHDGFSMFDSAWTDYKITNSPYGKDIVKQLADACHRGGLKLGFYYSPPDWYSPDFRNPITGWRHTRFIHRQLRELCTNYGKVDIIWFDGLDTTAAENSSEKLLAMIRRLQPGVLINNRSGLPADFDTPEQTVGGFNRARPWESCITIGNQWSYRPKDTIKSLEECLGTLIRCAGGDGNLLFNVGPMPTGQIEPVQADRLREMGKWLAQYGQSVYGTRGGPYKPADWGVTTCKGKRVFLHILSWEDIGDDEAGLPLLPPLPAKILSCRALTGGSATCSQSEEGLRLFVEPSARVAPDTLIELVLDRDAETLEPLSAPSRSLSVGKPATASNVYQGMTWGFGPQAAVDGNLSSRWATDSGTLSAWLEVDLGAPLTCGKARLLEAAPYDGRVKRFRLLYRNAPEEAWQVALEGTELPKTAITFTPFTARYVRLDLPEAIEGPTIADFSLYPPSEVTD